MKQLNPYLAFAGTCREALNFYKDCLGGEILAMSTFGESPMPTSDETKDRVMHAEFKADGVYFMASDSMPDHPVQNGNSISMSLNFTDAQEQQDAFNKLSAGGQVTMPLQDTFWGATFGMLTDKFGINWMLNYQKDQQ